MAIRGALFSIETTILDAARAPEVFPEPPGAAENNPVVDFEKDEAWLGPSVAGFKPRPKLGKLECEACALNCPGATPQMVILTHQSCLVLSL
jgi:hypothetical protein